MSGDLARATRSLTTLIAILGACLVATPAAAGGDFDPTIVLRTREGPLSVSDIAARRSRLAVLWAESRPAGPALFYRISLDRGASFAPMRRVDDRPNADGSLAICRGSLWIASALHVPGDPAERWDIVVDRRELDGPVTGGSLITDPFADLTSGVPDVACVGERFLAVAWLQRLAGAPIWEARLRIYDAIPPAGGVGTAGGFSTDIVLGRARGDAQIAVAATDRRVLVAWKRGTSLRLKRIDVGLGDDPTITPHDTQVVGPDAGRSVGLDIEASLAVLAFARGDAIVTRRSTDGGQTFGPIRTRLVARPDEAIGVASLDVRGPRVLLEAFRAYGDFDGGYSQQRRFVSSDGGRTWDVTRLGSAGTRVGAWAGPATSPSIVEAWDDIATDPPHHVRFHRQS
jgi:hypothetical protein